MATRWAFHSLFVLSVVGVWSLLTGGLVPSFHPLNPVLVGRPLGVLSQLLTLLSGSALWSHLWTTLSETLLGLLWALAGAVGLALLFEYRPFWRRVLDPWLNAINALPKLALAPFLVVWVGIGLSSKVWISASMAFFPLFYSTLGGLDTLDTDLVAAHRVMGIAGFQLVRIVMLPAIWRWTLSALRAALGLALTGAVVGEFIGSTGGLGYLLVGAQGFMATNRALALLALIGGMGVLLDVGARYLERRAR